MGAALKKQKPGKKKKNLTEKEKSSFLMAQQVNDPVLP